MPRQDHGVDQVAPLDACPEESMHTVESHEPASMLDTVDRIAGVRSHHPLLMMRKGFWVGGDDLRCHLEAAAVELPQR